MWTKEHACHHARTIRPARHKTALPSILKELIDRRRFLTGLMSAETMQTASMAFKKVLIERALGAEFDHHLATRRPSAARPEYVTKHRNGKTRKTALTKDGPLRLETPSDHGGSFKPVRLTVFPSSPQQYLLFGG